MRLRFRAREMLRVGAHAGAQLRDPHIRPQRAQRWRQSLDLDRRSSSAFTWSIEASYRRTSACALKSSYRSTAVLCEKQ
jgi:hypothetical protein